MVKRTAKGMVCGKLAENKTPASFDKLRMTGELFLARKCIVTSADDYIDFLVVSAAGAAVVSAAGAAVVSAGAGVTVSVAGAAVVSLVSSFFSPLLLQAANTAVSARIAKTFFIFSDFFLLGLKIRSQR